MNLKDQKEKEIYRTFKEETQKTPKQEQQTLSLLEWEHSLIKRLSESSGDEEDDGRRHKKQRSPPSLRPYHTT